jgi:uncharacterized protein (TIGR03000 family)
MRKLVTIAVASALLGLLSVGSVSAGHRGGCGGGHHGCGGHGGCGGSSSCGSCGYGGCGSGGCGSYGYGGCSTCGGGAYVHAAGAAYCPTCTGPDCPRGHASLTVGGPAIAAAPAEATLVVTLPADAKLLVDDYQTTSTSAERTFRTPALEAGKDFSYTLTAQVVRNGKTESITKEVTVRAGAETRVSIDAPAAAAVVAK